jgi:SagB-type dehydrogenase family enzyme
MLPYEDFRSLPLLYHLNSEPWMNQEAYSDPSSVAEFRPVADPERAVRLPEPDRQTPLGTLLRERRSCRAYEERPMALATVSTLLDVAYGALEAVRADNGLLRVTRPEPSAGGLYPLEIRCAATYVEGLPRGVYRFNPLHHCLEPAETRGGMDELGSHLLAQYFLEHANLVLFLSAVFERTLRKYGMRGYRYVLLEAGHVAQNLCLSAAEQHLGALCAGGFRDGRLNEFLGLDTAREAVVYCVGIGYPAPV